MHWNTLTPEQQTLLKIEEEDLEICALDDGIARFHDQNTKQPMSKWPACRVLISSATQQLASAISADAAKIAEGRGMKGGIQWGHVFLYMNPEVLAIATICGILDTIGHGQHRWQPSISRVGSMVEIETHFTVLKDMAPRLKAVMERKIKRWDRRTLRRAMCRIDEDCAKSWSNKRKLNIGAKLVGMAVQHAGLFELVTTWSRSNRQVREIRLTPYAMEIIAKMNDHLEILYPMAKPMVVPPNEWADGTPGGYLLLSGYHHIVKGKMSYPDDLPSDHGPLVYGAINALQSTPWRINRPVLSTMQRVWTNGGGWAGLPHENDVDIPVRPSGGDVTAWAVAAEKVYRANARAVGKRLSFLKILQVASEFQDKVFYYPHHCDFRGRIYPIPQYLQPQGDDINRGLLTFADAEPLGERGMWWLRVQYANCWGKDKMNFGERVGWANDALHDIITACCDCAARGFTLEWDPLDYKALWAHADDPWQALATLIEIVEAWRSGDPHTYECSLPINVDGSNSGLQHFSAMLRDSVGARLVNLSPCDSPHDIYTDVAVSVKQAISEDAAAIESGAIDEGEVLTRMLGKAGISLGTTMLDLPRKWLEQGIDRKLTKRGTMTYCYGVTPQGLKNALIDDGFVSWADHQYAAVQYIGKHIWRAIQENITGATTAMDWLRGCAKCANKAGVLLHWRTPSGFHVAHPYQNPKEVRIRCLSGEAVFRVYDPDRGLAAHRQRNGLPPNFVHSLDASHLIMTVAAAAACGIHHFMVIHDSFGTHACKVDLLRDILREQFVRLYEVDVLEAFRQQVIEQTGYDPGPSPAKGDFDLDAVHESTYVFS